MAVLTRSLAVIYKVLSEALRGRERLLLLVLLWHLISKLLKPSIQPVEILIYHSDKFSDFLKADTLPKGGE